MYLYLYLCFSGDTHLLIDHFMDLFHQSASYRKQAVFIMNEILLGTIGLGKCIYSTDNYKLSINAASGTT